MSRFQKLSSDILSAFSKLDTPCISDAMDRLGVPGGLLGIRPIVLGTKICGQAFTVHYTTCGQTHGTVGDFIDDIAPGEVAVLDNGGRTDCTVWGDIMALYAVEHGLGGTIIDGVCRDIPIIRQLNYPIFTKGQYMVTGKDRVYADRINEPVSISGVQVRYGDLIIADDSGALCIPLELTEQVLAIAQEIDSTEQNIINLIQHGSSLRVAREKTNYHTLQTKRKTTGSSHL